MKLLDIFTGTGSVAKVAKELGYEVISLDIDSRCNPTVCADIMSLDYKDMWDPHEFDIVWSSPPCDFFSAARRSNIGRKVRGELVTAETLLQDAENIGVPVLRRCQEIIEYLQPKVWFIENPYTGKMKDYITKKPIIYDFCMFGFKCRKRTAIWSNKKGLVDCKCDRSHLVNGRHQMTCIGSSMTQKGQGGGDSKKGRYAIPKELVELLIDVNRDSVSHAPCKD